jgi:hypothetical protein
MSAEDVALQWSVDVAVLDAQPVPTPGTLWLVGVAKLRAGDCGDRELVHSHRRANAAIEHSEATFQEAGDISIDQETHRDQGQSSSGLRSALAGFRRS